MAVTKIGHCAFYHHPNLKTVRTGATRIEYSAFTVSPQLEVVDLVASSNIAIESDAFNSCKKLRHVVLRSLEVANLIAPSAFNGTPMLYEQGGIYVPANLLSSYKNASNWSTVASSIYPIEEYPRSNFDTISDSWSDIFSNNNYSTDYSVGDTKTLELTDETEITMKLVAKNIDIKSQNIKIKKII